MRRLVPATILSVVLAIATTAPCDESGSAESLFREGRRAMKAGDFASACASFAESQRLDQSPGTLLNLAICEEQLGHVATAWAKYRDVTDIVPDSDPRSAMARRAIQHLDPKLPRIRLGGNTPSGDSVIELDGSRFDTFNLGVWIPIDPGQHRVMVHADGQVTKDVSVQIVLGQHLDVDVSPSPMSRAIPPATTGSLGAAPRRQSSHAAPNERSGHAGEGQVLRKVAYVAGGVAATGFVAAGVFAALAVGEKHTVDTHCLGHGCDEEGLHAARQGNTFLRLADAGLVMGCVGVVAGGVLFWQSTRRSIDVHASSAGVTVAYSTLF